MKIFCVTLAIFCAIVGVGVLEDCAGDCVQADANAMWRWVVAVVAVVGTTFFGLVAVQIKD